LRGEAAIGELAATANTVFQERKPRENEFLMSEPELASGRQAPSPGVLTGVGDAAGDRKLPAEKQLGQALRKKKRSGQEGGNDGEDKCLEADVGGWRGDCCACCFKGSGEKRVKCLRAEKVEE
jgi:hypothetical protein